MRIPHPIQYQGSKRNLASVILKYFPKKVNRLVEPFAGSAAISIACASRGIAKKYLLNDYNEPLIRLLELIINNPNEITNHYENIWNQQHNDSIEHYYQIRENFNRSNDPSLFLYLLSRCVKGSVRYNSDGFFNQSPDKRRRGARPDNMKKNIQGVSFLLKGKTEFLAEDYKALLNKVHSDDLVYMDPPYQGVCGDRDSRYFAGINYIEFIDFLSKLNNKKIDFIVSYDGRCGNKSYGSYLPNDLGLAHIELEAGRSSQATLLGKRDVTVESLYLSNSLVSKIDEVPRNYSRVLHEQLTLMERKQKYEKTF